MNTVTRCYLFFNLKIEIILEYDNAEYLRFGPLFFLHIFQNNVNHFWNKQLCIHVAFTNVNTAVFCFQNTILTRIKHKSTDIVCFVKFFRKTQRSVEFRVKIEWKSWKNADISVNVYNPIVTRRYRFIEFLSSSPIIDGRETVSNVFQKYISYCKHYI